MKRKADRVSIRILHIEVLLGLVLAVRDRSVFRVRRRTWIWKRPIR